MPTTAVSCEQLDQQCSYGRECCCGECSPHTTLTCAANAAYDTNNWDINYTSPCKEAKCGKKIFDEYISCNIALFSGIGCQTQNYLTIGTEGYTGTASMTSSGRSCQLWSSTTPHNHQFTRIGHHNYCRNPNDAAGGVWCYTTDPNKEWEHCAVPSCDTGSTRLFYQK